MSAAWTAQQLADECRALAALLGREAYVGFHTSGDYRDVGVHVRPLGCGSDGHKMFVADAIPEAFAKAREWVEARAVALDHGAAA